MIPHVGRPADFGVVGKLIEQVRLVIGLDIDGVDEHQRVLFARIVATLENAQFANGRGGDTEPPGHSRGQGFGRVFERQAQFVEANHRAPFC